MVEFKKQLKFGETEPDVKQEVRQEVKEEQIIINNKPLQIISLAKSVLEYEDVVVALSNCLRDLDARIEMAHNVLPEMEKQDVVLYLEAHKLYRELLWKWQRARLALLMLKLEHPDYKTEAIFDIEKERKEN